jgi:hypothetical protein
MTSGGVVDGGSDGMMCVSFGLDMCMDGSMERGNFVLVRLLLKVGWSNLLLGSSLLLL